MKILKFVLAILLITIGLQNINAQRNCDMWYLDANFTYFQPTGDLATKGFTTAYGPSIGGYFALNPNNEKFAIHIGARVDAVLTLGKKTDVTLVDPFGANAKASVYNSLVDGKLLGRAILLPDNAVRPYLEAYGGVRLSGSHESLNLKESYIGYDNQSSEQIVSSESVVWGGGAGTLIRLSDVLDLDLRVTYDQAGNTEFVDLNSYQRLETGYTYDMATAKSSNYALHVGLRFNIGCGGRNNNQSATIYEEDIYQPRRRRAPSKRKPVKAKPPKS